MTLFALYERFRPWREGDTYVAAIILASLFLLVVFNRCKSFLANGLFIGCAFGYLCAGMSDEFEYSKKTSYVDLGMIVGLLLGALAKMIFPFVTHPPHEKSNPSVPTTTVEPIGYSHSPAFWIAALAISGIGVGLTLAVFFKMTYREMAVWIAGLLLTGCVLGGAVIPVNKKIPWMQTALELWLAIALTTATGAIIGWKFVWPILMFDVNPPIECDVLFRLATCSCAAAGGLIGLIAWTLQRKAAKSSLNEPNPFLPPTPN